ncbi:MAG TPA: DegV family protein [Acidimicrobiales bacterium]|jgi:DegV family protein with EDD domain|nr:DegV family protein [Acidimicrobiales bacterium]
MPGIRVVADSACDLPEEVVARYRLTIVPLTVRFGAEEVDDLGPKDFWVRCRQSPVLPATAAPSPGAFAEAFRRLADEGAEGIVCITLAAKLSATFQAAQAAVREVTGIPVEVIDSSSVSLGQGLLVLGAARLAEEGKGGPEVAAWVRETSRRLKVYGVLDTLDNLKKGGRVGGAKALFGSMLAIKPVIEIRDGEVHEESKQRTRGRSLQYLAAKVTEAANAGRISELGIMHGDASDIDKFIDLVAVAVSRDQMLVGLVGAVIGTHAGAGVIGVAWIEPPA